MTNTMTATEFLASLPAPFDTHGGYDDTLLTKLIRDELAAAVRAGVLPAGTKVSVRKNHYQSFTVEIVEWHAPVFCDNYVAHVLDPKGTAWNAHEARDEMRRAGRRTGDERYTAQLQEALALIETIADRHNYNNSDLQVDHFDVGYYLTVRASAIATSAERGLQTESDPAFAELVRQAEIAAKAVGPKVVRSVCGRGGVRGCGQWALERLIKVAANANGRPLAYDKRRSAWVVAA